MSEKQVPYIVNGTQIFRLDRSTVHRSPGAGYHVCKNSNQRGAKVMTMGEHRNGKDINKHRGTE